MTNHHVVLVGCGNMGYAMLQGWLAAGTLQPQQVTVIEPFEPLRERAKALGVATFNDSSELSTDAKPRVIVIAVKPQIIADVLPLYQRFSGSSTFVSIAAGTPVSLFEKLLGADTAVIRCMPNLPAAIGKGMMVTFANPQTSASDAAFVESLLQVSGAVATITDEKLMDAVTAVSGSGPGYIFHLIECLTQAALAVGLPQDIAGTLAIQTVYGAGAMAAKGDDTPTQLRKNVTSPNGTTAAGLAVLMQDDHLQTLMTKAVKAAHARSVELGKA